MTALAGCSNGTTTGNAMMGGVNSADSAYHYSSLTCAAPKLPGSTVTVRLSDMGMTSMMGGTAPLGGHMALSAAPSTVVAGRVSLVAQNIGWRTHELVVLPLKQGDVSGQLTPAADGKVAEAGSLGEASGSCAAGSGKGIAAGSVGWVTLALPAGRYELVCNLANHYANGMRQELDVTG